MSQETRSPAGEARSLALGFVFGRQSAGDPGATGEVAREFAEAFSARECRYEAGEVSWMPSVQNAYIAWCETGSVVDRAPR